MGSWLRDDELGRAGGDPFLSRPPDEEAPLASALTLNSSIASEAFDYREGLEPEDSAASSYERKRAVEAVLCGAVLPCVTYTSLVFLYTYKSHCFPVIVRSLSFLFAQFCIVAAWPSGAGRRRLDDFWPLVCAVLAVGCGVGFGMLNANELRPWLRYSSFASYTRVRADVPSSLPLADAGFIVFAHTSVLDVNRSVGFYTGDNRYCVAPVVNPEHSGEPAEVIFWAVGVDCCDPRGDFWCSDARDPSTKSALIHEPSPWQLLFGGHELEHFKDAVKMAESDYGFPLSDDSVWLDWVADPKAAAEGHRRSAAITCVVLVIFGAFFFLASGLYLQTPRAAADGDG